MAYRDLGADFVRPDGVEWIPQLDAAFAHVKDEHGQTADPDTAKLFPVSP